MPSSHPASRARHPLVVSGLLAASLLTAGCTTTSGPAPDTSTELSATTWRLVDDAPRVPVVRYGRYTLVELVPDAAQRDLLQQVIDIAIPTTADATVGDALRHVLRRSGYRLCDADFETAALHALPLPAAHLHLGPLVLRDALLTLAGPAWDLSVDDATREVCFTRHVPAALPNVPSPGAVAPTCPMDAATTFPVPEVRP
ncbi:TPA: PilL N-terminal domain-containing protein [Pseudomonas aeruginosa]|uniref:PFGI-1 class ICE element type IV pilus protein PilL2 n=1 Tax=Pseudomonas aeruginosa TaxID=287 RepID=UPI001DEE9D9D|nr:PilL N-terminal domain-containing protein [Pseudomonas aeruginosa]MBX6698962.1 PilL N-terminal domain-containing protein [Pseudomonas aeruginosa]WMX07978.1 PilL N-terminal domain-containing protein [Pseudomonas aeruginosa]HCF4366164.1 PilL N-terminal domain-containing protein [Pseudomonas aeruginosa]HCF4370131.1 PilL N-terminal domain-containing protein [Pseudomonas aeruginosa]HCF4411220.1 PilL N-terminal domain-containing protein [Pseudomonas aeruginosa]